MRTFKAILALVLVAALFVTLFAACATNTDNKPSTDNTTNSEQNNTAGNKDNAAGDKDNSSDKEQPSDNTDSEPVDPIKERLGDDWDYEVETLVFYLLDDSGENTENEAHVEAAMNEYLKEYGIAIDIRFGGYGTYPTYLTMDLYSGEAVDLAMMYPGRDGNFLNMYSDNLLLEIGDLLEKYAPETLELMAPYMNSVTYNGGVWGVPGLRALASSPYLIMRTDILTELGLEETARAADSWSDVVAIWDQVKANYDDVYPVGGGTYTAANVFYGGKDAFADAAPVELPDSLGIVVVKDDVAQSLFTWDKYLADVKMSAEWLEKGYIYPDAIHTQSLPDELIASGVVFSYLTNSEIGIEATKEANLGVDLTCIQVGEGMVAGGSLRRFGVTIPNTAECPEKAAFVINLMYTDPTFANLIAWGVEGTDYVVNDQGEACFPESGATYHNRDFLLGNQFLCLPWEGQGSDFRKIAEEYNNNSPVSDYLTFSFDSANLDNQIANLSAVLDEFQEAERGGYYTEETHQAFLNKLNVAGIDEWVNEVQKQIDAWRAAQ